MESSWLAGQMYQDSNLIVFINVLLQQLGLPLPSVPIMVLAGSQVKGMGSLGILLVVAISASLLADWLWYQAGRKFGYKVLALLCRLSINPTSCVTHTEARFTKWGLWSLVFGKFIPGFSTIAPPVAGAVGIPLGAFLGASAIGAGLWAGLALLAGHVFHMEITDTLLRLSNYGVHLITLVVFLFVAWITWKFYQKWRFERLSRMHHVSAQEVLVALAGPRPPHILDLRKPEVVAETGCIPGARITSCKEIGAAMAQVDKNYPIITLCACPQDATAVQAAHSLKQLGYTDVHPFRGGFESWKEMAANNPAFSPALLAPVLPLMR